MDKRPEISVIIPTLNEQKYIKYPISGLKKQTFDDFETIFVDGASEDGTVRIAGGYSRVVTCTKHGVASARNMGAGLARGRILLFLDADTKPSPRLLETYSRVFSDPDVAAATGPIYPIEDRKLKVRVGYALVSILFVKASIWAGRPSIVGSNFAVRADRFWKANGFREELITYEDWDLSYRIKRYGKVRYSDDAVVRTSARRILAWGLWGYFAFYLVNMMMYHVLRRARTNYKNIR